MGHVSEGRHCERAAVNGRSHLTSHLHSERKDCENLLGRLGRQRSVSDQGSAIGSGGQGGGANGLYTLLVAGRDLTESMGAMSGSRRSSISRHEPSDGSNSAGSLSTDKCSGEGESFSAYAVGIGDVGGAADAAARGRPQDALLVAQRQSIGSAGGLGQRSSMERIDETRCGGCCFPTQSV